MKTLPAAISAQDFDQLFKKVCNWGVWGDEGERGTLNYINPESVRTFSVVPAGVWGAT